MVRQICFDLSKVDTSAHTTASVNNRKGTASKEDKPNRAIQQDLTALQLTCGKKNARTQHSGST